MTGAIVDRADRTQGDVDALGWIDERADGPVTWLPGEPRRDGDAAIRSQQQWLYWNRRVTTRASVVDSTPWLKAPRIGALPETSLQVDDRTGLLRPQPPSRLVVTWRDSPHHQPVGDVLARAPGDGQELVRLDEPARLRFPLHRTGARRPDSSGPAGGAVVLARGRPRADGGRHVHRRGHPTMTVRVGDRAPVTAPPRAPVTLNLRICDAAEQVPVEVEGAGDVVTMDAVAIRPAPPCRRTEAGENRPSG